MASGTKQRFASNLKRIRERRDFQKNALARAIGVSASVITQWEDPESSVWVGDDKIDLLCTALGGDDPLDPEEFFKKLPGALPPQKVVLPKPKMSIAEALQTINRYEGPLSIKLRSKPRSKSRNFDR